MKLTKLSSKAVFLGGALLLGGSAHSAVDILYKHTAVAPENINQQKLPEVKNHGIFSHSTMLPIEIQPASRALGSQVSNIEKSIYLDAQQDGPLIFLSPNAEQWQLELTDPNGRKIATPSQKSANTQQVEIGGQSFKGKQLLLQTPATGKWRVKLTRTGAANSLNSNQLNSSQTVGYLMFKGDPKFNLYTHLDNNFTVQNSNVNISTYLSYSADELQHRDLMLHNQPLTSSVETATALITSPSGTQTTLKLNDRGIGGDKIAGDGSFSAKLPTSEVGVYTTQIQVIGTRPDGLRYSRTTTDLYRIEQAAFRLLQSTAKLDTGTNGFGQISIPVKKLSDSDTVYVAAEVWGTTPNGERKAAAWVGGITNAESNNGLSQLKLNFDLRWLQNQNLRAPLALKSLRLQSADNHVPIASRSKMRLSASTEVSNKLRQASFIIKSATTVDQAMLMGPSPTKPTLNRSAAGGKLLLVHGYCSGKIWNTSDFSDSVEFVDYKKNRSHEEFAQKIIDAGASYPSYGIVAHSQGGAAALHLYSRYWSGLDNASGGRLIQSLGTPYQGTSLAGNLAALGKIFGIGCGKNTDLTYSGAANWLATIPNWARAQVDYYTTSFKTRWWAYDYCHLGSDLLLSDPEDGTTEKWAGQLSGAVNKGHKKGWCHTTGMRDPAQYKDSGRNSTMNSNAAR